MCQANVGPFSSRPGRVMDAFRHVRAAFQKVDSRLCCGGLGNAGTSVEPCRRGPQQARLLKFGCVLLIMSRW